MFSWFPRIGKQSNGKFFRSSWPKIHGAEESQRTLFITREILHFLPDGRVVHPPFGMSTADQGFRMQMKMPGGPRIAPKMTK